jgi:hypothetical protein
MSVYRITDEPAPSASTRFVVDAKWPLFASMFAGCWLSWPWFVWNGFALGSPSAKTELAWVGAGFAGNILGTVALLATLAFELAPMSALPYMVTLLSGWKLFISYQVYVTQARTFGLFEAFGGAPKNGAIVIFAGFMLRRAIPFPLLAVLVLG